MWSRRRFLASVAATLTPVPPPTAPTPFIDSHVHVWKHDPAFPFAAGANPPAEDATVDQLLELMQANQVLRTVLIQVIHYRWDNRYLASMLKRYPRTFKGVCRVDPQDPAAPDQLSRLTEVDGFHGVRLSPSATPHDDWIRGPLMPPLWRRCAQLEVPMTILAPVTRMPDLVPLIEQNSDLKVVIDHMAVSVPGHALRCGPETSVTSPLRWRWVELSGHERTYIQPSRPWECGNPEGISKECGKGGKPASWLSMLSILCHFHDLLFARHCWINRNATQRHAPRSPRTKIPAHWRKRRAIRTGYLAS
jgi:hypothetical protein